MKQKGFTLIELLVVIAIIGILSSVVLASLNTARDKAANVTVKDNLNNLRSAGSLFYENGNTYSGFCTSSSVGPIMTSAANAGGGTAGTSSNNCSDSDTEWAAYSVLKVPEGDITEWCVDSTGASKGQTADNVTTLGTTATACI
jgi:prepilin-type N-terminal cleavage/methylation domain-containing protein